jgi:hypothetical protein
MCLRKCDTPTGALYWNRLAVDIYAGSAYSQSCSQAALEGMKI